MPKQQLIGTIIVIIVIGSGIAFWLSQKQNQPNSDPIEEMTVAATQTAMMVWIAQDKGFFRQNGLKVTLIKEQGGHLAVQKMLSGEADIATCSEFVLVSQSFSKKDIKTLGTVATADNIGLVARRDHGIQQPLDLKGKKIGVTRNSAGEYFLGTFMLFNNMSLDDIEMVDMDPKAIQKATSNGQIDAGITWDPYAYDIEQTLKEKAVRFSGQSGQDFHFLLVSQSKWINTNPDKVERFAKALLQAEQFIREHQSEAQEIMIRKFNYDPTYLKYAWETQSFVVSLPQSLLTAMRDAASWKIATKQTQQTEIPDYTNYIEFNPLEKIKPNGITIIR